MNLLMIKKSLIDDKVKGYFYGRANIADAKNCL